MMNRGASGSFRGSPVPGGEGPMRGRVLAVAAACLCACAAPAHAQDTQPADDRFDVTLLDKNITQGTRIATTPDGRVLLAERDGRLKIYKPDTKTTALGGQIPTGQPGELGFI